MKLDHGPHELHGLLGFDTAPCGDSVVDPPRELENILERGVTLSLGPVLEASDIHLDTRAANHQAGAAPVIPEGMTLDKWEQEIIREALQRANGNKSQAARALGLSRNALRYRLSQMGVDDTTEKEP